MSDQCDDCGRDLQVGDWPYCPHGRFDPRGLALIADSIPGGMVIENLAKTPETFYSQSDLKRRMTELGVRPKVQHVGLQGSDKNPHTQRWI